VPPSVISASCTRPSYPHYTPARNSHQSSWRLFKSNPIARQRQDGSVRHLELLLNYTEGKPKLHFDLSGSLTAPLASLSDEELNLPLEELLKEPQAVGTD
jgi:hypothetical protein